MKRKYKIINKSRFLIFIALTLIVSIYSSSIIFGINKVESLTKPIYSEIQVESGDTLWALAKEYGPVNADPRKVVRMICNINNVNPNSLFPGQIILIPQNL